MRELYGSRVQNNCGRWKGTGVRTLRIIRPKHRARCGRHILPIWQMKLKRAGRARCIRPRRRLHGERAQRKSAWRHPPRRLCVEMCAGLSIVRGRLARRCEGSGGGGPCECELVLCEVVVHSAPDAIWKGFRRGEAHGEAETGRGKVASRAAQARTL